MTAPVIRVGPAARRDLDDHVLWLRLEADPTTARRFALAVTAGFDQVAASPGLGSPVGSRDPQLATVRKWRVGGFPKVLVFYLPVEGGVRIVRVLHAAQDWWALLDAGPD